MSVIRASEQGARNAFSSGQRKKHHCDDENLQPLQRQRHWHFVCCCFVLRSYHQGQGQTVKKLAIWSATQPYTYSSVHPPSTQGSNAVAVQLQYAGVKMENDTESLLQICQSKSLCQTDLIQFCCCSSQPCCSCVLGWLAGLLQIKVFLPILRSVNFSVAVLHFFA